VGPVILLKNEYDFLVHFSVLAELLSIEVAYRLENAFGKSGKCIVAVVLANCEVNEASLQAISIDIASNQEVLV